MMTEKKSYKTFTPPTDEEISVYAYYLWEQEGRLPGRDVEHWLQAKAHLIADRQFEAGILTTRPAQRALVQKTAGTETEEAKTKKKKSETPRVASARQAAFV